MQMAMEAGRDTVPAAPLQGVRYCASLLVSAALHAAVLLLLAGTSVQVIAGARAPIKVTILDTARPPLGGGGAADQPAEVIPAPMPAQAPETELRKPARPKIQRRDQRQLHEPAPTKPAPETAATSDTPGSPEGAVGGALSGVPGAQVGGTVSGRGDQLWRADQVAGQPRRISGSKPIYPPLARARGIEGLVVLDAIIDRDGRVEEDGLKVARSVPLLDNAAIAAVREWRFEPGRDRSGAPVRVLLRVPIRFQLR
jgi:protein TonB